MSPGSLRGALRRVLQAGQDGARHGAPSLPRAGSAGAPRLWAGREGAGSLRWAGSLGPEVRVGRGRGGDCGRAGGAVSAGVAGPERACSGRWRWGSRGGPRGPHAATWRRRARRARR